MSRAILRLENVNTYYGKIHALKDISFEVDEGEIVTLIGSNGAGKTTTLKTISALLRPAKGDIVYMGKKVNGTPAHMLTREGIAHVPEGRKIFPRLTVEENLEMGAFSLRDQGRIKRNKDYVYELFPRLLERKKQRGGTLSGGEQQMLAMGRGLMSDPKILLLDEPSMGLAPMMIQAVFDIIKKLKSEGITILLVEQNAGKALKLANKGYVLQTGSIILEGTGAELLNNDVVRQAYLG